MSATLSLNNISMTYYTKTDETKAIDNLSFDVNKGEFVAIVGPSGCGKTTILSIIAGILKPTFGEVLLNGSKVEKVNNEVGYMLQHDHLFEWRTIYKNIILGLEIQKKSSPEALAHIENLLEKYNLKDFKKYYPSQLSGGMRQRVALIRTLALDPDVLLLDEPFSALDFQTRLQVCDDVYDIIKKEEKTALLVTHDISEAISMADKIIVLTNRPASVKRVHFTHLEHISTPLKRREDSTFSVQFEQSSQNSAGTHHHHLGGCGRKSHRDDGGPDFGNHHYNFHAERFYRNKPRQGASAQNHERLEIPDFHQTGISLQHSDAFVHA